MRDPVLVIDSSYLAWRAYHTVGNLSYKNVKTGVLYGFMRDIITLQELHNTDKIVFCFDSKKSLRKDLSPIYKANRHKAEEELSEEQKQELSEVSSQINALRRVILPALGFKNIVYERGYEADDHIAQVCKTVSETTNAIIVSADRDLLQLLSKRVSIWRPANKGSMYTKASFVEEFGIKPKRWVEVKAIAGCPTDNVIGVKGIGEITAVKYLLGKIRPPSKKYSAIVKAARRCQQNYALVRLPFPGTPEFEYTPDKLNSRAWRDIADMLGMRSIRTGVLRVKSYR